MSNALSSSNMADFLNVILSFKKLDKHVAGKNNGSVRLLGVSILLTLEYYTTYYSVIKYFIKKIKALIRWATWLNSA